MLRPWDNGHAVVPAEERAHYQAIQVGGLDVLIGWRGRGELYGGRAHNNRGPDIDEWRAIDGTAGGQGGAGAWCAVVQCAADQVAVAELEWRLPWKPSRGARRYAGNVAEAGRWICKAGPWPRRRVRWCAEPTEIPPGSYVLWDRGDPKRRGERWKAHIERFVAYDRKRDRLTTIGGNRNNRSDAAGRPYAVVDFAERSGKEWRRRLAGIASAT
jgi:hypothetical protein